MASLVYFPNFEPQNDKWLKFSLLYLDEFRPIIPDVRRDNISDLYKVIRDETDLINPYSPKYIHGEYAGTRSAEEIDKILINPERYIGQFNNQNIEEWKNQEKWNYFIYEEKYSSVFKDYCLKNNLGKEIEGGISLSEEVGYIFMKNLANEISKETNSSIITDSKKFQKYDAYKVESYQEKNEISSFAESVINLRIPTNINHIEFNKIIEFRNKNRDLIKNFQIALENIKTKPDDISAFEFIGEFDQIYSKSMNKTIAAGAGIALIPLSIYSYFESSTTFSDIAGIKEWVGIVSGMVGTGYSISEILTETENKRQCIKYFANLKNLY